MDQQHEQELTKISANGGSCVAPDPRTGLAVLGNPFKPANRWHCHDVAAYFLGEAAREWPGDQLPSYTLKEASVLKRRLSALDDAGVGRETARRIVNYVVSSWRSGLLLRLPMLDDPAQEDPPPDFRVITWRNVWEQLLRETVTVARRSSMPVADGASVVEEYRERVAEHMRGGVGLLLWGPRDATRAAAEAVAATAMAGGYIPRTTTAYWVADVPWRHGSEFRAMEAVAPLVLHDLGQEGWWGERHDNVVRYLRHRMDYARATIVTTVLDPVQLELLYGERLVLPMSECMISAHVGEAR